MKPLETTIPFTGFYETIHDSIISDRIDDFFCDRNMGPEWNKTPWELDLNYSGAREQYAREYVRHFCHELSIQLEFKAVDSPREYNFTTDRIICTITPEELDRIYGLIDKSALHDLIKEEFTDRSGFISFYQNGLTDTGQEYRITWDKPLLLWDHNQIGTLLECYASQEGFDSDSAYVENFYFDDLTPEAMAYSNFLYEKTEAGVEFDSLPDFSDWKKSQEKAA